MDAPPGPDRAPRGRTCRADRRSSSGGASYRIATKEIATMNRPISAPRGLVFALAILVAVAAGAALASESPPSPSQRPQPGEPATTRSDFDRGMEKVEAQEYADARQIFEQLAVESPKNPDVLNMLAYTQRKTGAVDEALGNYRRALELRPKFPQAREYLAEAYLQLALREAETLRSYGGSGEEQLQKLAKALQDAASQLDDEHRKGGKTPAKW
jgi:predicted Zn-dependent protease